MRGRDHQGLTNMSEDVDTRLSERQKGAVALLCCAHAHGSTRAQQALEADELMRMLGVHPLHPVEDETPEAYERLAVNL